MELARFLKTGATNAVALLTSKLSALGSSRRWTKRCALTVSRKATTLETALSQIWGLLDKFHEEEALVEVLVEDLEEVEVGSEEVGEASARRNSAVVEELLQTPSATIAKALGTFQEIVQKLGLVEKVAMCAINARKLAILPASAKGRSAMIAAKAGIWQEIALSLLERPSPMLQLRLQHKRTKLLKEW